MGQKYGMLTVVGMKTNHNGRLWYCVCDCGKSKEKPVSGYELRSGIRTNCGCMSNSWKSNRKHGQYNTKLYKVWSAMKHRCGNKNDPAFSNYGGRGITVCEEWMEFVPFMDWAHSSGYKTGLTIERINNDGNYEPKNCEWISKPKQSSNTRRCVFVTHKGQTMNLMQWSKELNMPYSRLQSRIKNGWSFEKAINTPLIPANKRHCKIVCDS